MTNRTRILGLAALFTCLGLLSRTNVPDRVYTRAADAATFYTQKGPHNVARPTMSTSTYEVWNGTTWVATAVPSGALFNQQVLTASGTWTKPSGGYRFSRIIVIGGGGGGGGGNSVAAAIGGGGGGGSCLGDITVDLSSLGSTETVTVGAGGSAGTAATVNSNSAGNGGAGGNSSFGTWLTSRGGRGGFSGSNGGTGGAQNIALCQFQGAAGAKNYNNDGSFAPGSLIPVPTGGGGGGYYSAFGSGSNGGIIGGTVGPNVGNSAFALDGGTGSSTSAAGGTGLTWAGSPTRIGTGGGGGAGSATTLAAGSAGGIGGAYGGGGGGGGAGTAVFAGGAGGVGGAGVVIVNSW